VRSEEVRQQVGELLNFVCKEDFGAKAVFLATGRCSLCTLTP